MSIPEATRIMIGLHPQRVRACVRVRVRVRACACVRVSITCRPLR